MIKLKNLTKEFYTHENKQIVLRNINLEVKANDFITIMGPSGGGKSTLLQIISGLLKPTSGEIYYEFNKLDYNNEKLMSKYRRENIGLVFQNHNLISCLNPVENLLIAMNSNLKYKDKIEQSKKLLNEVGLSDKYNSDITSLSGGEAQRVAIVRALVNKPKIILCDEPTGALDSVNSKKIIDLLLKVKKETKSILIIVTHDKDIGNLGDRKIYIKDGEILEVERNI